jgi:membrane-associated phospholipid phosphatase
VTLHVKVMHQPAVFVRRLEKTARTVLLRLAAPPVNGSPPAWTGRMTIAALVAWLGVVLIHPFDAEVVRAVGHSLLPPFVVLRNITNVGRSTMYLIATFAVGLAISLIEWQNLSRRTRARLALIYGQAVFAFAALALSGIAANIVKIFVGRARPSLLAVYGPDYREALHAGYDFASFPSGHSTTLGAIAAVLTLWFPRLRLPVAAVALVLGFSRCAADAHYPSDVWGGLAFGFLFTIFMARLLARRGAGFRFADGRLLPRLRFARPSNGQKGVGNGGA